MNMNELNSIKKTLDCDGDIRKAIDSLTALIATHPESDLPLVERGLLYWKLGERASAINDYNAAIAINPESKAVQVKEATYSILNYYNKDLYNP